MKDKLDSAMYFAILFVTLNVKTVELHKYTNSDIDEGIAFVAGVMGFLFTVALIAGYALMAIDLFKNPNTNE